MAKKLQRADRVFKKKILNYVGCLWRISSVPRIETDVMGSNPI